MWPLLYEDEKDLKMKFLSCEVVGFTLVSVFYCERLLWLFSDREMALNVKIPKQCLFHSWSAMSCYLCCWFVNVVMTWWWLWCWNKISTIGTLWKTCLSNPNITSPSWGWGHGRCCLLLGRQRPGGWWSRLRHSGDETGKCSVLAPWGGTKNNTVTSSEICSI